MTPDSRQFDNHEITEKEVIIMKTTGFSANELAKLSH